MQIHDIQREGRDYILKMAFDVRNDKSFKSIHHYCKKHRLKPAQLIHWLSLSELKNYSNVTFEVRSNKQAIELMMEKFKKNAFTGEQVNDLYRIWLSFCFTEYLEKGSELKNAFGFYGKEPEPFKHWKEFTDWELGFKKLPASDDPTYSTQKSARRRAKQDFVNRLGKAIELYEIELSKTTGEYRQQVQKSIERCQERILEVNKKYKW